MTIMSFATLLQKNTLVALGVLFLVFTSFTKNTNNYPTIFYAANLESGTINSHQDNPKDNIFQIDLTGVNLQQTRAYLVYDLYGIDHYSGVARSINEELSSGGYFVKKQEIWSSQREEINPEWLKTGINVVRFALPSGSTNDYNVRRVGIQLEEIPNTEIEDKDLIIDEATLAIHQNQLYLKGYIKDENLALTKVYVDDQECSLHGGAFESVTIQTPKKNKSLVRVIFSDGSIMQRHIDIKQAKQVEYSYPLISNTRPVSQFYDPLRASSLVLEGVFIQLETHCFATSTPLVLNSLKTIDVPPLDLSITNVNAVHKAVRFSSNDTPIQGQVTISLAYDPNKIPAGYVPDDIKTFRYDYETASWEILERTQVDFGKKVITSKLNKGGDYINGIIQVPESPEGQSYKPTEIKDIKAANPSAAINLMNPPVANNRGTASISYPFNIPAGRQGLQPQLALTYNSGGDNSWCGLGWNLNVPTVTVDTRWGVPRFDTGLETEIYSLNGEQLTMFVTDSLGVEKSYLPNRSKFVPRDPSEEFRRFHPRVEGAFQKVMRRGDKPDNYWWEITDKSGTRYLYGRSSEGNLDERAILRDAAGNIAHWALVEVRDLNDNYIRFHHQKVEDAGVEGSSNMGQQLYCKKITYTGHENTEGKYSVVFTRDREMDEPRRKDVSINGRYGFKQVTADLLRKVEVQFNNRNLRSYELIYREGAFYKTLLDSIVEYDAAGQQFIAHQLEYYDEVRNGETYQPLGTTEHWTPQNDDIKAGLLNPIPDFSDEASMLGGGASGGGGGGIAVTVGVNDMKSASKTNTAGASFGFSASENNGLSASVDINGDGLTDKVFKTDDGLFFRPNQSGPTGVTSFGERIKINGISDFSKGKSRTLDVGIESHFGLFVGAQFSNTKGRTTIYFTDTNGDQLIDIVKNGQVFFNHLNEQGEPTFTLASIDTPSPILACGGIDPELVQVDPQELENDIDQYPLHDVVKMWQAPYTGVVSISGSVQLVSDTTAEGSSYTSDDGVAVSIQVKDSLYWKTAIPAEDSVPRIPTNVDSITLQKGDRIYFRTQSVFDGAYDQVNWTPTITYTKHLDTLVDANGLPIYQFNAKEEFLVTAPMALGMPISGEIEVDGLFKKPITSDDIKLEIIQENVDGTSFALLTRNYSWDTTVEENIIFPSSLSPFSDNRIEKGANLYFRVSASTNIDWTTLEWSPRVHFVKSNDPNVSDAQLFDRNGQALLEFFPVVDYTLFNYPIFPSQAWTFVDTLDHTLSTMPISIEALLSFSSNQVNEDILCSVKSDTTLLTKRVIQVRNGLVVPNQFLAIPTVHPQDSLQKIYVEYHTRNLSIANQLLSAQAVVTRLTSNPIPAIPPIEIRDTIATGFHTDNEGMAIFGELYRGWGQFTYNGNRDRADAVIDETELKIADSFANTAQLNLAGATTAEEMQNSYDSGGGQDPSQTAFIYMMPDMQLLGYKGYDELTYIKQDIWSSSRLGEDDLLPVSPLMEGAMRIESGAVGINKVSKTNNISTSIGAGPLGESFSGGTTTQSYDYMDMNGDRYPDILSKDKIQYTLPIGGLEDNTRSYSFGKVHESSHFSAGFSLGGTFPKSSSSSDKKSSKGKKASTSENKAKASAGISGNFNVNTDETSFAWMDINGDGLPDRVHENGAVELNLGYKFLPKEQWRFGGISDGSATSYGAGLNINIDNYSLSVGLGMSRNENSTGKSLQDMNGDGLLDYVFQTLDALSVAINTGSGFAPPIPWVGADEITEGESVGESINGAFTACVPVIGIKICFNPSANASQGMSRTTVQISDVDGDGFPDYLKSDKDNELKVKRSTIGRTNKLKGIKRPLGSTISLEYQRVGNTYDMPNSIWTLSQVAVFDGFLGDGADTMRTRMVYEEGYYDRHEREFYGFKKVRTEQLDTENEDNIYRKTVQSFKQNHYYDKGLIEAEILTDEADNIYTASIYNYDFKNIKDGNLLPESVLSSAEGTAFPALSEIQKNFYEGQMEARKATNTTFAYDRYGNIIQYEDFGDTNPLGADISPTDNYITTINYHEINDNYLVGAPSRILVKDVNNTTYRHRETAIDSLTGNITQIRQYLDNTTFGVYDMEYDEFGNIKVLQRPENHQGERLSFAYTYDPEVNIFVTQVTDGYGHRSSSTYDYRFGQLLNSIDINGQEIQRSIDNKGRITRIRGPYEIAEGGSYTIRFAYQADANVPWALTQHYDPQHPDNPIETVTFIDGLARVLQIKKDGAIFNAPDTEDVEQRIVSGRVIFDAFGRSISTYYPTLENLSVERGLFNPVFDNIPPTLSSYDILDRTRTVILPDDSSTEMQYSFGEDRNDQTQFLTKVIDQEGNIKDQYTNVRGLVTATLDYIDDAPQHGNIWTSFTYNAINELLSVKDDQNNETISTYDNYGRRVSRDHPDHGLCTYEYDLASNITAKQTANIRAVDENFAIRYLYDKERLQDIKYPINPVNNVHYDYGVVNDSRDSLYNRIGRVKFQADATGTQIFFYDRLGEVAKNIRSISIIRGRPVRTFTTRYKYDTWNRITRMVYPDGEVLDYSYNKGGKLRTMKSEKLEVNYDYINQMGYDKFEQRVYCALGNGATTTYAYEPDRRRLSNMLTQTGGSPRTIMDNLYRYDKVSNILNIKNNARIPTNALGGPAEQSFEYDDLYRLTSAKGYWGSYRQVQRYGLNMTYNSVHDIVNKYQDHQRSAGEHIDPDQINADAVIDWQAITSPITDWERSNFTSYILDYDYNLDQPHAPGRIGVHKYRYDANGNMVDRQHLVNFGQRRLLLWDEEDRLMSIDDDERVHHYVYDANNIRVVKQKDIANYVYVNGELVVGGDIDGAYTVYVNPEMVVSERGYTKHFFIEGQRICTKLGTGGSFGLGANWGDWGNWTEWQPWDNWANNDDWDNWYNDGNWEGEEGVWNSSLNVEERFRYFFHSDHLGSTGYITDRHGEVHQHLEYLPFGETFVQEHRLHTLFDRSPYLFNGKELDEETQLYYYGARYYDPHISRWLSVDPLAENYQGWSPYNYTLNNPVRYIDPDGKEVWDDVKGGVQSAGRFAKGVGRGVVDGVVGSVKGVYNILSNPKKTVKGIKNAVVNYDQTWDALKNAVSTETDKFLNGNAQTRGEVTGGVIAAIGEIVVGAKGLTKATKFTKTAGKGKGIWTSTKTSTSIQNAFTHWKKHAKDFPEFLNAKQYVEGARNFLQKSPTGTLTKVRANGDILKYHPKTNRFAVMNSQGIPRTMFKPKDGMKYWQKQK